jgi:nucleoside-diphosphate-sugar epimerase
MHLSANEGIEDVWFAVTGGQGFVTAALYLELLCRGTREVRSLDLHASSSSWSQQLLDAGVRIIQGHVKEEQDYVIGRRKR